MPRLLPASIAKKCEAGKRQSSMRWRKADEGASIGGHVIRPPVSLR
jgi:hypothetical protein